MENENYATRKFPLRIETMCVRNPFDAHNPIYHPYHNTSNNSLQEIEEILFSFNLWDDWDVLDCPRRYIMESLKIKKYLDNCSINTIGSLRQ